MIRHQVGCIFMLLFASIMARAETLGPGAGRFEFHRVDKTVPVWYYLPEAARDDAPVLIVMHGVGRDARRYRDVWMLHARERGFVLIVPEFSQAVFPGSESYSLGGVLDEQGRVQPREQWAFSFIEPIFDAVKAATGNRSDRYLLFGHSAGAQFVHRFLYFMPEARVAKVVAANAGWWTLPDPAVDFPYGLRGAGFDEAAVKTMLQRPLTVLLGTADTDPNDVHLRRTPDALAQGSYRFARGQFFFACGERQAAALGVPFGWQLATAPGVAHTDGGMAPFAVRCLFGEAAPAGKGALLFSDDFDRPALGEAWRISFPEFTISDGVLKAAQVKEHSAVGMVKFGRKDVEIEFKFQFAGASGINAVCNDRNYKDGHAGHICRVSLSPTRIFLADDKERLRHEIEEMRKDPARNAEADKLVAGRSAGFPAKIEPHRWYQLAIVIVGDEMRVSLDGNEVGSLKSSGLAHPTKTDFYFAVSGHDALFDDLHVWEAAANN